MTYVYWGGRTYGKINQQGLFRWNRKTVSQNAHNIFKAFKWEYVGDKQIRTRYYWNVEDDKITRYVKSESITDDWLYNTVVDKGIKNNDTAGLEKDWLGGGRYENPEIAKKREYNPPELRPIWDNYGHFHNDIITCDLYLPQPYVLDGPFISTLKTCKHVVGYKSDMVSWFINVLNYFVASEASKNWGIEIKDPKDAYDKDKEIIFGYFDHHLGMNRDVEQRLRDVGIEYDYLDLDNDNYAEFFGLERNLPRDMYSQDYKKYGGERYNIAKSIAEEYIDNRQLTGWKLDGRIHDKV